MSNDFQALKEYGEEKKNVMMIGFAKEFLADEEIAPEELSMLVKFGEWLIDRLYEMKIVNAANQKRPRSPKE